VSELESGRDTAPDPEAGSRVVERGLDTSVPYMLGQFAALGVAAVDELPDVEPDVEPEDEVDGVCVVVELVAAWAATAPPKTSAPVIAVAAMAFRM
jgi:hypothetical protein